MSDELEVNNETYESEALVRLRAVSATFDKGIFPEGKEGEFILEIAAEWAEEYLPANYSEIDPEFDYILLALAYGNLQGYVNYNMVGKFFEYTRIYTDYDSHDRYWEQNLKWLEANAKEYEPNGDEFIGLTTVRSAIHELVDKYGIRKDNIGICVLEREARKEFIDKGHSNYCIKLSDGRIFIILLQSKYLKANFEHEYIHSQSNGFSGYFSGFLFVAMNEGFTESLMQEPRTYLEQRKLLDLILNYNPELHELFMKRFFGERQSSDSFYRELINRLGFENFLKIALAQAYPHDDLSLYFPIQNVIDDLTLSLENTI